MKPSPAASTMIASDRARVLAAVEAGTVSQAGVALVEPVINRDGGLRCYEVRLGVNVQASPGMVAGGVGRHVGAAVGVRAGPFPDALAAARFASTVAPHL